VVARIWSGDLSRVSVVIRIVVVMIVLRVIRRGRRFWMRRCPMSLPDSHSFAETVRVAKILLEEEEWFQKLPAAMKDHLSQPNHDQHIAVLGRQLARLVTQHSDGTQEAHDG
jgi:hypothetical protein